MKVPHKRQNLYAYIKEYIAIKLPAPPPASKVQQHFYCSFPFPVAFSSLDKQGNCIYNQHFYYDKPPPM